MALLFLGIVTSSVWEDRSDLSARVLIGVGIIVFFGIVWDGMGSYTVTRQEFVRKTWPPWSSWHVAVADIHAVDLDVNGEAVSLTLILNDDRKRLFPLNKHAQEKLGRVYPELSDEDPDFTALAPHDREDLADRYTRTLRGSALTAVISLGVLAADLTTAGSRSLPRGAETFIEMATSFAAAMLMIALLGVAYAWFQRRQVRQAGMPSRWILYGILAVVGLATVIMLWISASKGLITW